MEQNFKIQVPDGCSAKIEQQEGFLVVVFEPKKEEKWVPKDGDVYVTKNNGIGIYNANYKSVRNIIPFYCGLREDGILHIRTNVGDNSGFGYFDHIRPATEEEKRRLFDALAREGKRWNAETKQIEDLPRWRAQEGDSYYYVNGHGMIVEKIDYHYQYENDFYAIGNYFRSREAAERVAEQVRRIFKESKAE